MTLLRNQEVCAAENCETEIDDNDKNMLLVPDELDVVLVCDEHMEMAKVEE